MAWLVFFTLFALYSFSIAVVLCDVYLGKRADALRVPVGSSRRISQINQIELNMPEPWRSIECPMDQQRQKTNWKSEGF